MECVAVCAAGGFALADVAILAVAALVAVLAVAVVSVLLGYAWALALAVAVMIPPAIWLLVRVWKHGPTIEVFRRHRRPVARQTALPAGSSLRAIESKMVTVTPDMILRQAIEEEAR